MGDEVYADLLKGMHIASAHNHPIQYGSPPSGKNFQMLSLEFEEYELIFSQNEFWILESREEVFDKEYIDKIRENLNVGFESILDEVNDDFGEGIWYWIMLVKTMVTFF